MAGNKKKKNIKRASIFPCASFVPTPQREENQTLQVSCQIPYPRECGYRDENGTEKEAFNTSILFTDKDSPSLPGRECE